MLYGALFASAIMLGHIPYQKIRASLSPQYRIRLQQKEADDQQRRIARRKAREEGQALANLDWALAHPDNPRANRYLKERLAEADKQVERAELDIRLHDRTADGEGPDAEKAKAEVKGAENRLAEAGALSDIIREALDRA